MPYICLIDAISGTFLGSGTRKLGMRQEESSKTLNPLN